MSAVTASLMTAKVELVCMWLIIEFTPNSSHMWHKKIEKKENVIIFVKTLDYKF